MLQASWLDNQIFFLSLPIFFPHWQHSYNKSPVKMDFLPSPLLPLKTLQRRLGGFYQRRDLGESPERFWKSELGGFLPNCVCTLTVSGERHSSKLDLFKDFTVLEGIHQDSPIPAGIPLPTGHRTGKHVSF